MSALTQSSLFPPSRRPLSAVEVLRAVSHITWNARHEEPALAAIAAAILRVPGLTGFRFEPAESSPHLRIYEVTRPHAATSASAVAPAAANGQSWGQIRLFFDTRSVPAADSPVRLARFLGQQTGILLHRITLERDQQRHLASLAAIETMTRRRKAINRAANILAAQRNASRSEALSLLVKYARQNRKSILEIADSLILGFTAPLAPLKKRTFA